MLVYDWKVKKRSATPFAIRYGVASTSCSNQPIIELVGIGGNAVVSLLNLDIEETALYLDIIGRLVMMNKSSLEVIMKDKSELSVVDPVLFRPKLSSDTYSRICQKKFQPVISTGQDKKSVEYYNFTFNRPEYYKCPSAHAPVLGFIKGKHNNGYCIPCCRKTQVPDDEKVRQQCISNVNDIGQKNSTYKIDYPIISISNTKIMNRRFSLPEYVMTLLDIKDTVANGTVLASHPSIQDVRDGMNPNAKSFLQTAILISCIEGPDGNPLYKSYRSFIIDVIGMLKHPINHSKIMRNPIISQRYTSPQGLIHDLEDKFIRLNVLELNRQLSAIEWNDLIVFFANCMNMNVLLLSDERIPNKGVMLDNLKDVDVNRPVFILLKRLNLEWSSQYHNTRSLYYPITKHSYKVYSNSELVFERLNTTKALTRLKNRFYGPFIRYTDKQFNETNISKVISVHKTYKASFNREQKIAIIDIRKHRMVSTIFGIENVDTPENINEDITATLESAIEFIKDYNKYFFDETPHLESKLRDYKLYVQSLLASKRQYGSIDTISFMIKISRFIAYEGKVIGIMLNIMNSTTIVSTEMIFTKPTSIKAAMNLIDSAEKELDSIHKKLDLVRMNTYPFHLDIFKETRRSVIEWSVHPLKCVPVETQKCSSDLMSWFNKGSYYKQIYSMFATTIINRWKQERSIDIQNEVISFINHYKALPIVSTQVDSFVKELHDKLNNYDHTMIRAILYDLFDQINSTDKTIKQAITRTEQYHLFNGFELKNVFHFNKVMVKDKVDKLVNEVVEKVKEYPTFDLEESMSSQRSHFFKDGKLLVADELFNDLVEMLISDLINPFRREYVVNLQLAETTINHIKPHIGELIYIYQINS